MAPQEEYERGKISNQKNGFSEAMRHEPICVNAIGLSLLPITFELFLASYTPKQCLIATFAAKLAEISQIGILKILVDRSFMEIGVMSSSQRTEAVACSAWYHSNVRARGLRSQRYHLEWVERIIFNWGSYPFLFSDKKWILFKLHTCQFDYISS